MRLKEPIWIDSRAEAPDSAEPKDRQRFAYFGYQKIAQEEKLRRTCLHFESVAGRYDFMNTLLSFGIHYFWKHAAVGMMKLKPGDRVLDVCGGTGDLSILAQRAVAPNGQVILYDINSAMIQAGRSKPTHTAIRRRIRYVQGNAEALCFPDNHFDAVMVGFGIRNLTRIDRGFAEMHRVLKPGGRLMCLEFSKPTAPFFRLLYDFYSFRIMPFLGGLLAGSRSAYTLLPESIRTFPLPDELAGMLKSIGLRQVTYRRLTNGIAVVHLGEKMRVAI